MPEMLTLYETGNWRIVARARQMPGRAEEYLLHIPCLPNTIKTDYIYAKFPDHLPNLSKFCEFCTYIPTEQQLEYLTRFVELYYRYSRESDATFSPGKPL